MSNRLTPNWTKHVQQAYGQTGVKGFNGETWLATLLKEKGYDVTIHEDNKQLQLQGIDITVDRNDLPKPITIDVKANIKQDGTFFIETSKKGWLLNPKKTSNLIWHVDPTTGWTARYSRKTMVSVLSQLSHTADLFALNVNALPTEFQFIKVTKENI